MSSDNSEPNATPQNFGTPTLMRSPEQPRHHAKLNPNSQQQHSHGLNPRHSEVISPNLNCPAGSAAQIIATKLHKKQSWGEKLEPLDHLPHQLLSHSRETAESQAELRLKKVEKHI